jgi:NADPH-dependent 2,4-dienoyl-CoA reductase/sulfur reductase-like enzyme
MNREFVIIGAGPAGLTAAKEAASQGVKVVIIDENDRPGGQLFTQTHKFFGSKEHSAGIRGFQIGEQLLKDLEKLNVEILLNTTVYGIFPDKNVMFSPVNGKIQTIKANNILIATGGLEKPVTFNGWTLPGVMGAGAAQTMMNVFRVLPGKKALMIGTGNVGLIVSYQLKQAGCEVAGVIEILPKVSGYMVHASKIRRASIPILTSYSVREAKGTDFVESAVVAKVDKNFKPIIGTEIEIDCDLICIAAGLQPFNELCWQLKMDMKYIGVFGGFVPIHDKNLETSISGIFVAGDLAGIEEASTAMEEGRLVGSAVAWKLGYINKKQFEESSSLINNRLLQLRLGSFGIAREKGKELIISSSESK